VIGFPMLLQLGIGFDGRLIWRMKRRMKGAFGFVGVTMSALRHGVTFDFPEMRVRGDLEDGSSHEAIVTSVLVANAKRWAGPQITVPHADPGDDYCDLLLLDYRSFPELAAFWLAILFPNAPHLRLRYVRQVRMRRVHVEAVGRPVEAHVDGEPLLTTPLSVEPLGRVTLLGAALE
jgi:diacylglycerol kinase family enzyme